MSFCCGWAQLSLWSIHASLSQSHLRNAYVFLQSLTVAKTIYTLDWHRCDAINKKILLIMINYTQKGSRIRVPFYDIELPTFTKVCVCCMWGRAEWECLLSPLTLLIIFISIFKLRYFNRLMQIGIFDFCRQKKNAFHSHSVVLFCRLWAPSAHTSLCWRMCCSSRREPARWADNGMTNWGSERERENECLLIVIV